MGRDVIGLCTEIGRLAAGEPRTSRVDTTPRRPFASAGAMKHAEILALGATGFIGRELARQLLNGGNRIRVLVRNPGRLPSDLQRTGS